MKFIFKNYEIKTNHPEYDTIPIDYYSNARFVALALSAAGFEATIVRREHYADGRIEKVPMRAIAQNAVKDFKVRASYMAKDKFAILNIPGFYEKYFGKKEQ